MAGLSTHILDTHGGRPGAGVAVSLRRVRPDGHRETLLETAPTTTGEPH